MSADKEFEFKFLLNDRLGYFIYLVLRSGGEIINSLVDDSRLTGFKL